MVVDCRYAEKVMDCVCGMAERVMDGWGGGDGKN
jgi:hypothetical protein